MIFSPPWVIRVSPSVSGVTPMINTKPARLLRVREVSTRVGLSRTTIWRMCRDGRFPRPVQLSTAAAVGFVEAEVDAWVVEQIDRRDRQTGVAGRRVTAEASTNT